MALPCCASSPAASRATGVTAAPLAQRVASRFKRAHRCRLGRCDDGVERAIHQRIPKGATRSVADDDFPHAFVLGYGVRSWLGQSPQGRRNVCRHSLCCGELGLCGRLPRRTMYVAARGFSECAMRRSCAVGLDSIDFQYGPPAPVAPPPSSTRRPPCKKSGTASQWELHPVTTKRLGYSGSTRA